MCGIVGYVGSRPCKELLLHGLERLEYRGYDSAGICLMNGQVDIVRRVGKVSALRDAVGSAAHPATTGLAHTRWATHGGVIEANAHPIEACEGSGVTVVHNGIIENYATLRRELSDAGHEYHSDTDSEVIAHLIEECYSGDLVEAVRAAYARLDGHFAFAAAHRDSPGILVAARRGCPLVVGRGGGRDVHGVGHPGVPQLDAQGAVRARRRDRGRAPGRRDVPLGRRRRDRARRRRGRLGRGGGREAGLRDVHAEGDRGAARRDRRDDRRAALPRRAPARRPRALRARDPRPLAGRLPGLRHLLPRRTDRPLPARGVGPDPVGVGHRERVALPACRDRRADAGDRRRPVGRDDRHAGGDEGGAGARRARPRGHERDGLADDARVRLGPLHARGARDRRRGDQDVHGAGDAHVSARAQAGADPRHDRRHPGRHAARAGARPARPGPADARSARPRRADRRPLSPERVLPLPGPQHGPADRARGRAQAEGDLLHRDRRVRGRRDEARPDRAPRRADPGRGDRDRLARLREGRLEHRRRCAPAAPT